MTNKMKDHEDWDKVAAYERYFADRYGKEVLQDVRDLLTPEKYEEYRKEMDELY